MPPGADTRSTGDGAPPAEAGQRLRMVLALLAAPGVSRDLAGRLARDLPEILAERFPEVEWQIHVSEEPLAAASVIDVDLVQICRQRMLSEGWDVVVCLTELPLMVGRRPVTAHVSVSLGVGLVSVPALGPVSLDTRLEEAVLRVVDSIVGERLGHREGRREAQARARARAIQRLEEMRQPVGAAEVPEEGTVRFVTALVRGNLRLVLGMVRANRPWRVVVGLSRAVVAALGVGAFGIVSPAVWIVANGASWGRLIVLAVIAIFGTFASLILAHGLWEHPPEDAPPPVRENVLLFNVATLVTVFIGVLTLFLMIFAISAVTTAGAVAPGVLESQVHAPASTATYIKISVLVSTMATIGGALGAALESDRAVREAAYGYRPPER